MPIRRSGPRDERRRRVLMDPSRIDRETEEKSTSPTEEETQGQRVRYGQSAHFSQQPPITQLIPKRGFVWTVVLGVSLCLIAAIQAGYGAIYVLYPTLPAWRMFDPLADGSLARWLNSTFLMAGAAACVLTYALRRHRIDDYRGGYRYWLWAAAAFILGSIDASVGLHELLAHFLNRPEIFGALAAWMTIGTVLVFLLIPETLSSRAATTTLTLSFLAYCVGPVISLGELLPIGEPITVMLATSGTMLGHLLLTTSIGYYLRYVYLDAHNELPAPSPRAERVRQRREEARKTADARREAKRQAKEARLLAKQEAKKLKEADEADKASEPAEAPAAEKTTRRRAKVSHKTTEKTVPKTAPKPAVKPNKRAEPAVDDGYDDEEDESHLSKSERRRLRKLKRRQKAA